MAGEFTTPLLDILGILKKSLQISPTNGKLMVSIMLFTTVPFCLIAVVTHLIITPLAVDLASKEANLPIYYPNSRQAKEIRDQIKIELVGLISMIVVGVISALAVLFLSLIASVYLSAMTYISNHLTLKELISRIRRSWKKPLITASLFLFLSLIYSFLASLLIDFIFWTTNISILQSVLSLLVSLAAFLFYVYLSAAWMLAVVISVVEDDCCGGNAFAKAGEIIRGRRIQGFLLMLLPCIMRVAICVVYVTFMAEANDVGRLAATIIMVCLECLVLIFVFVVSTVFYYQCARIIDEETTVNCMYRPINDQDSLYRWWKSILMMLMAEKPSIPPLGILGIVRESLQIPAKNGKLMVPITLLTAVPFCLIAVVRGHIMNPLQMGLASKMVNLPKYDQDSKQAGEILEQIKQEIGELVLFAAVSIILKCTVLFFSLIATVCLSTMAYTGKHLMPKELILRIRRSWKSPLITALLVLLLSAGYGLVAMALRYLIAAATSGILLAVLYLLVSLPASLLYAYFSTIWMLGLVISVVEEDCYAMKALEKAGEIIKGRKLQGFLLMLLLYIMALAIYLAYLCTINIIIKGQTVGKWVATIIMACLECLVLILMFVVNTVFYHECMKAIDDEAGNSSGRANYALVPTTED